MQQLATPISQNDNHAGTGARLVTSDGKDLPLRATHLEVSAQGGMARAILTQTFVNDYDRPLRVRYLLPLPADGAVSGFSFTVGETRIVGEIDRKAKARERFEQAISEGRSAAILDQERANTFTQEVGNIPAGATVHCEVVVDQPLAWLSEGSWEWRFPTVLGPRYLGRPGAVADAGKVTVPVSDKPIEVRGALELSIGDPVQGDASSPSHAINQRESAGAILCSLRKSARLDRDVVVRWPVAAMDVGVSLQNARPSGEDHAGSAFALATIVPPQQTSAADSVARDLIVLLDTSGSMSGEPLSQAKRIIAALIDSLEAHDRLELIEFSSRANRWRSEPVVATRDGKKAAHKWVRKLRASGSTEMRTGILEALRPLREDAQRQVVLITDGYIGNEAQIIRTVVEELPAGCRIHTVGVGSSVNRALTKPVAAAGAGVELVVGIGEDVEPVLGRLVKRTAKPVVTELEVSGSALVEYAAVHLPDLYAESPALLPVRVRADGGTLLLTGRCAHGSFEHEVEIPKQLLGSGHQGIVALFGREKVEELETRLAAGDPANEIDAAIEELGLTFQISTRLTSWVAIGEDIVSGGKPLEVEMPHELPYGTSAEGFGLRSASAMGAGMMLTRAQNMAVPRAPGFMGAPPMAPSRRKRVTAVSKIADRAPASSAPPEPFEQEEISEERSIRVTEDLSAPTEPSAPEPVDEVSAGRVSGLPSAAPPAPAKSMKSEVAPSVVPEQKLVHRKATPRWIILLALIGFVAILIGFLYLLFGVLL